MKIDYKSLEESVVDTVIGMPIMMFLSTVSLYILIDIIHLPTITASIVSTLILTIAAIIRKYSVRIHYKNK